MREIAQAAGVTHGTIRAINNRLANQASGTETQPVGERQDQDTWPEPADEVHEQGNWREPAAEPPEQGAWSDPAAEAPGRAPEGESWSG